MTSPNPQPIHAVLEAHGFSHFGFTQLGRPPTLDQYRDWLDQNYHGGMEYLSRHFEVKADATQLLPKAQSAIVVAAPYPLGPDAPFKKLKIAGYAKGEDYHIWLKQKLEQVIASLKDHYPHDGFYAATDSAPILERDLAYRAGLGWVGKNTCLIDQKRGSLFLIGEILTTLVLQPATTPHADRCGTCNRCIEACPTDAIVEPRKLDARRCISYLTIESKEAPAPDLRRQIGDHFFGCDICQTVCPWNEPPVAPSAPLTEIEKELSYILLAPNRELQDFVKGSPLERSRAFGLKRNAVVVAANLKLKALREAIRSVGADPRLAEISAWALKELES